MSRAACISRKHPSPTIYSRTILGTEKEGSPGQGERKSRLEAKKELFSAGRRTSHHQI